MNLQHVMTDFEREFHLEAQAEAARTEHLAMSGAITYVHSGRMEDLPDEELDALVTAGMVEQRERDARRDPTVIPDHPF